MNESLDAGTDPYDPVSGILDDTGDGDAASGTPDVDPSLGALVVPLLRGVVYRDEDPKRWQALLALQSRVRDHVAVIGLELLLDESEGHAFLRSGTREAEDPASAITRLVERRPLSFPVSLLLALLRRRLVELDVSGEGTRLVLSRGEIADMLRLFLPDGGDEAKLVDRVDTHVNKLVELRFVRRLKGRAGSDGAASEPRFEVRRIVRAFVDAEWLDDFDARLAAYARTLAGDGDDAGDERTGTLAASTGSDGSGTLDHGRHDDGPGGTPDERAPA